jgi:hypothetical protein
MRKLLAVVSLIASLLFFATALATPASADPNSPGNNGTVKIHDADTAVDDMRNEPHVCRFYVDGFKFDDHSSGQWWIESWPPTGDRTEVRRATWTADAKGDWHSAIQTLPDGHYKLYAKQQNAPAPGGDKQKVFWVECPPANGGATATPTPGGSQNNGEQGNGNAGNSNTGNGNTGNGTGGTGSTGSTGNGNGGNGNGGANGSASASPSPRVAGFQENNGGSGSVSPIVELPGGSQQSAPNSENGAVRGTESAPAAALGGAAVAGVQSLPSTSTGGPAIPLAGIGFALAALGGALLRRSGARG